MPPKKSLARWKSALFAFITTTVAGGLGFITVEAGLRLLAARRPYKNPLYMQYRHDSDVGLWMAAGSRSYINAHGMYERPVSIAKLAGKTRIAMLGDSFMQGVHPVIGHRMSEVLQQELGDGVETLNFGISSVGTVQELYIYRHKVRPFKPDIVVLGLLTGNDIRNNSRKIERTSTSHFLANAPYCDSPAAGDIRCHAASTPSPSGVLGRLKAVLRENSHSYHLLSKARHRLAPRVPAREDARGLWGRPWPAAYVDYGVYGPPRDPAWEEAWRVTEYALRELRREVEADGARFILVILTDPLQLEEYPRAAVKEQTGIEPPADFDPDYPNRRVAKIAERAGIETVNLLPAFRAHMRRKGLDGADFAFPDDGHWNRREHRLAGGLLAEHLRRGASGR